MKLGNARGEWLQGEDWKIMVEEEVLWTLPRVLDEREVMSVIRMGRKFEQDAFKEGIEAGVAQQKAASDLRESILATQIRALEAMNTQLSEQLERHLDGNSAVN